VTVSARRLQYLAVSYLPPEELPSSRPERRSRSRLLIDVVLVGALAVASLLPLDWPIQLGALICCLLLAVGLGRRSATVTQDPSIAPPTDAVAHADADADADGAAKAADQADR
jgi:hypothetical protein